MRLNKAGSHQEVRSMPARVPEAALLKMAKLGAVVDRLDGRHRRCHQRRAVLDLDRRESGRCSVHGDEHDERQLAIERLRSRHLRRTRHARSASRFRHPFRPARLEQQLRIGSQQSRVLPLLQPAKAFFPLCEDGLPGDHRRHRREGKHIRHLCRTDQAREDELCALLHG